MIVEDDDSCMKTGEFSTVAPAARLPGRRSAIHQVLILLAVVALASAGGCRSEPPATESFTPPYLRLNLCGGAAAVQLPGSSEWRTAAEEILVNESIRVLADPTEGARFCLGDDSILEMNPAAQVALENPRVLPRLQVVLEGGILQFLMQKPSYAFLLPGCNLTVATVPARVTVEMLSDEVHVMVEEGALTCASEAGTVTLVRCQDVRASDGQEPNMGRFCEATAVPTVATTSSTPSPSPGVVGPTTTATSTSTPTPSPTTTPTPRPQLTRPIATLAPTLTDTPTAPPPPPPTSPPPPRPTNTPAPQPTNTSPPPPTDTPPPPPTDTPQPPPTDTPRPTPAPSGSISSDPTTEGEVATQLALTRSPASARKWEEWIRLGLPCSRYTCTRHQWRDTDLPYLLES
jgi:hypothetical protein